MKISDKLKAGNKNKKLVTQFTQKKLDAYKLRIEKVLSKGHMKKYYEIVEISNANLSLILRHKPINKQNSLPVNMLYAQFEKRKNGKTQVRQQYKNLQKVEHAFRDFKSDNIQIRPVYHRNEAQTRGHVLLSMFSYVIIKEMENKIYPFLKQWNKQNNKQLSFSDIMEELKDIKLVTLKVGRNVKSVQFTVLNTIQEQVLNLFGLKKPMLDNFL